MTLPGDPRQFGFFSSNEITCHMPQNFCVMAPLRICHAQPYSAPKKYVKQKGHSCPINELCCFQFLLHCSSNSS